MAKDAQVPKQEQTLTSSKKLVFDAAGFERDIKKAKDATQPSEDEETRHLAKLELWTMIMALIGLPLMIRGVLSPLSMVLLGYYRYGKFAILAHHNLHGGFGRERRGWYAQGFYRRMVDWLDWILPEAWIVEHNKIHHYKLNEDSDPDYVQRNSEIVQVLPGWPLRYFMVVVNAVVWKWAYYASNTLKLLHKNKPGAPTAKEMDKPFTLSEIVTDLFRYMFTDKAKFKWFLNYVTDFIFRVMGPPLILNFVLIPGCAFALARLTGGDAWYAYAMAVLNFMGAELVNNVHSFATIVTNHAGCDLWHFEEPCPAGGAEFILRSTLGSSAYHAGNDFVDYFHGFLNYQCEHHSFPELSPLHYQRLHPQFKKVCAKYGVPYVQEPVWTRVRKTADIVTGWSKHKEMPGQAIDHFELFVTEDFVRTQTAAEGSDSDNNDLQPKSGISRQVSPGLGFLKALA